jgi:type II secretory pathway pseudopilin PulG
MRTNHVQKNKGFSLIEIIVSLGVFMIVAVVATGSLLKIVDAGKKAQSMKAVVNNLQFALESMSREIRMGKKYHCDTNIDPSSSALILPQDCTNASNDNFYFAFEPSVKRDLTNPNDRFAYRYFLDSATGRGKIQKADGDLGIGTFYDLTSEEVNITSMRFVVSGSAAGDNTPAKVSIVISGYVGDKARLRSEFSMQTTVTQRIRE